MDSDGKPASPASTVRRPAVFRSVADALHAGHPLAPADSNHWPDIFEDAAAQPRLLRGICVYSGSTRLAELAARVGFETIWIEMEHGPADFGEVESLCMAIETGGGIAAVRVPDGQRHHVLRALEVGARIV